ncbi:MAG: hypothetical protein H7203_08240 [Rhizobacter sp.]|nr:hypothetical protein [Burkholderiales bacterium]
MSSIFHLATASDYRTAPLTPSIDAVSKEQSALERHLDVCKKSSGRLFGLRCNAELMHGFFAARFVTTLAIIAVAVVISAIVF